MTYADEIQREANKLQRNIDYAELDRVRQRLSEIAIKVRRMERMADELVAEAMEEATLPVPVQPVAPVVSLDAVRAAKGRIQVYAIGDQAPA